MRGRSLQFLSIRVCHKPSGTPNVAEKERVREQGKCHKAYNMSENLRKPYFAEKAERLWQLGRPHKAYKMLGNLRNADFVQKKTFAAAGKTLQSSYHVRKSKERYIILEIKHLRQQGRPHEAYNTLENPRNQLVQQKALVAAGRTSPGQLHNSRTLLLRPGGVGGATVVRKYDQITLHKGGGWVQPMR